MGADLCGYLLFGPDKLEQSKVDATIKHLTELGVETKAMTFDYAKAQEDLEAYIQTLPDGKFKTLVLNTALYDFGELEELVETVTKYSEQSESESLVYDMVTLWNNCDYRDMTFRYISHDVPTKVVFCGELSWGDGPNEGCAQYLCKQASELGILEMLGIE